MNMPNLWCSVFTRLKVVTLKYFRIVLLLGLIPSSGCVSKNGTGSPVSAVLSSPDKKIAVTLKWTDGLSYGVAVDEQRVLAESRLGLKFADGFDLNRSFEVKRIERSKADRQWENRFGKRREVRDHYQQLKLLCQESSSGRQFEVIFRAYNDGVAFRYVLPAQSGLESFTLTDELTEFAFADNFVAYAGHHEDPKSFNGSQEWEFNRWKLSELPTDATIGLPLLVQTPAAWVALTESDLLDWSGLWLGKAAAQTSSATGVTLKAKLAPRREGDGLVKATAPHNSPWRVLLIGREPGRLIESDLVLNLATPCQIPDTSWIKPGLMAWDHWWSGDVKMDTATLKQYIQLASDMGWPYQLIDWQWYGDYNKPTANITNVNPAVDMVEVRRFAREKNVRLWLWLYWTDAERGDAYKKAFAVYEQWGIAGIKIDFMDSDDQFMVNWYEKLTRAAAEHHLMINFHGAYKPTGIIRTWPNQLTREGILGNEYNRWSKRVTPEHKLTLPFTRFLAGPGDFTPGGFLNRQPASFKVDGKRAEVQGTRAAELALFVCYDSPICCVCDHPDHLRHQPGADFLKIVPTVWDETRVLSGDVGKELVMARRSGQRWFVGAMIDGSAREISIPLHFLSRGQWKARIWKDAADSAQNAEHLETETQSVTATGVISLRLAPAGGAVICLEQE
ncbi:MAG: glycoside hydrolase family 97 protein [Akkermansiaceae bacterium]|nr:glycoside hydrolase family 97 protein [Verrucomicrobiales bacterium]